MASLTIRNIPDEAKRRFRQIAAAHGRSMEEHMRQLIIASIGDDAAAPSAVRDDRRGFTHRQGTGEAEPNLEGNWVDDLVRIADGAGEGVFDREPQPLRDFDL